MWRASSVIQMQHKNMDVGSESTGKHVVKITCCSFPMSSGFGTCTIHDQGGGHHVKMGHRIDEKEMLQQLVLAWSTH